MPSSDIVLEARHITVRTAQHALLEDVSLTLEAGKHVTIIGPNGAGKTTLLNVLLGIEPHFDGTVIRRDNLRIGYMPQQLRLNPLMPMTVERFMRPGKHNKQKNEIILLLEEAGVPHLLKQSMHMLSGGEIQRVLLARSLLNDPELLVLDEPAQNLDISGQVAIYQRLEEIGKQRHCAILLVSHDLHYVMRSTNRVICLFHHICCEGQPEVIMQEASFQNLYGINISDVLAHYPHSHSHTHEMFAPKERLKGDCCDH